MKTDQEYLDLDKQLLWHPYTSMSQPSPHFLVKKAVGCDITLSDGRILIDGMSSWWSVIHGYNHPRINTAIQQQLTQLSHVMFGGLTHKPAIDLAETLIAISPGDLQRVFFSDSGSVSVEVGLKMAIQYWHTQGQPSKQFFVTPKSGYHGDTFAAMSVCDPDNGMHHLFSGALTQQFFISAPPTGLEAPIKPEYLHEIRAMFEANHAQLAGFIIEPVVQNAGGMRFYNPEYLNHIRALCDEFDILLIFDEIATGFGRTGKLFATDHTNICPDIMCVGKALTGGYMTLAATLTNDKVALGISENDGVFMHGPTFMGNPLACSAANASLSLLMRYNIPEKITQLENWMKTALAPCAKLEQVEEVRCFGGIGVVELKNSVNLHKIQPKFVELGVWIRPFGKLIYLMPPYVISQQQVQTLAKAIYQVVSEEPC
ncbi:MULTISPECIES: adenosylmethionine--8-amino-7-oxononanoate transaminase [Marinomonas]|uniref:Adenosylmethionine-8-amino-7-oxononanoate aminotransferase n=1 Tax=Marinomonas arctica TaxID=383750 RepID=A0A7H1J3E5_9GAMM|nr:MULTISPECIES: adenosylmethionine--8-amino-7-oxononanoate transaminase [Marinomonas]MCS7485984.1 adenosylmethionine-8-amino-7-oxononanoate aminotransferase [Marinomonas sp. BSi20414]QNT05011.1 adenosylmethionine--8-amino-7-oxononanoate transaminase [Marinomonas arctica]GGN16786.1 adenosylmethionine-8-amino-7-oxononanoate aminotransferase [Marinomonas arctica]